MGWSYTKKPANVSDFIRSELNYEGEKNSYRVLDLAIVQLREAYVALEKRNKINSDDIEVIGVVCLLDYVDGEIGIKVMDETSLPYYFKCPARILRMLTPTENENALGWRKECENYHEKNARKMTEGQIIKFAAPLNFRGYGDATMFRYTRNGRKEFFYALSDEKRPRFACRITNWKQREFEIIS